MPASIRVSLMVAALGSLLLFPGAAWAGEVLFGPKPFEVDKEGKITEAGRSTAVAELANVGPDDWQMHVWAELDGAKKGDIAIEFFDDLNGERIKAQTLTHPGHKGGKYLSASFKLEGGQGFNKEHNYEVELAQGAAKSRKLLASGKLLLFKQADRDQKVKEAEDARKAEEAAAEEAALAESVEPLAEEEVEIPEFDEPPPMEGGKCSAGGRGSPGALGLAMLVLAAGRRRR